MDMAQADAAFMNEGSLARGIPDTGERKLALVTGLAITSVFTLIAALFGGKPAGLAAIPLFATLFLLVTSFELTLITLAMVFFVNMYVWIFSSAVWFSMVVAVAFVLTNRDFAWKDLAHPLTTSIGVYGLCVLPSFLNAANPVMSVVRLLNVAAFLVVLYLTGAGIRSRDQIRRIVAVFLALALLNGLHVIVGAVATGKRLYGFAGLMYVDYAGLAVCVTATMALLAHGFRRILLVMLSLAIAVALILTQTRSTWLATLATLFFLGGYLVLHPDVVGSTRKRLMALLMAGGLSIAVTAAAVVAINPKVEERVTSLGDGGSLELDPNYGQKNSLITRMLIWDTAMKAFSAHPIVGIGVYGFSYVSLHYARMPWFLYEKYVAGMSPHQSHFAALVETGILGWLGFLVFLVAIVRYPIRAIREVKGERGRHYALVGAVAVVYCVVSMFFTDAWLWGQGIVLLGLILGLVTANVKLNDARA
jgi:O-antigen ligase